MTAWRLDAYSANTLWARIAEFSSNEAGAVERSLHGVYFEEYFRALDAKTMLAELNYVDRDFLEDYAAYYVRCFHAYKRTCVRIHFFDQSITAAEFEALFGKDDALEQRLASSYLGFVVIRPLPERVIGRTCLKTYPAADGRSFPITRSYKANLFGLELKVDTLAFQEQDSVIAACATSALWSAFHGTGIIFHHRIPSPVEITRAATAHVADDTRVLPSSGLTTAQMADAIRACDLEPFMMKPATELDLQAAVRAYVLGKVPVLLVGPVFKREDFLPDAEASNRDEPKVLGIHAVAVTGFRTAEAPPAAAGRFCLEAMRIDKLYCHDDRVGPFARMEISFLDREKRPYLSTSSAPSTEDIGTLVFRHGILVPVYHKIRVGYLRVLREIAVFDDYLRWLRSEAVPSLECVVWDVYLTAANELKARWLAEPSVGPKRRDLLERPLPRYVWLARGRTDEGGAVELLFDATGLEAAKLCVQFAESSTTLLSTVAAITEALRHDHDPVFAEFPLCVGILESITPKQSASIRGASPAQAPS